MLLYPRANYGQRPGRQGHIGTADGVGLWRRAVRAFRGHGAEAESPGRRVARGDAFTACQHGV